MIKITSVTECITFTIMHRPLQHLIVYQIQVYFKKNYFKIQHYQEDNGYIQLGDVGWHNYLKARDKEKNRVGKQKKKKEKKLQSELGSLHPNAFGKGMILLLPASSKEQIFRQNV